MPPKELVAWIELVAWVELVAWFELVAWVRVDDAVEMLLGDGVGDVESPPLGDAENASELQTRGLFSVRPV